MSKTEAKADAQGGRDVLSAVAAQYGPKALQHAVQMQEGVVVGAA
jgi:hypothetical protein